MTDVGELVQQLQKICRDHDRAHVCCAVLTLAVNMIHTINDKLHRQRFEQEYIKTLSFLSAAEEQLRPITGPADPGDELVGKMIRHVFRSIELGLASPEYL